METWYNNFGDPCMLIYLAENNLAILIDMEGKINHQDFLSLKKIPIRTRTFVPNPYYMDEKFKEWLWLKAKKYLVSYSIIN